MIGIGVIGAFTATVASFLMEQQPTPTATDERLARIEAKLEELLARYASDER